MQHEKIHSAARDLFSAATRVADTHGIVGYSSADKANALARLRAAHEALGKVLDEPATLALSGDAPSGGGGFGTAADAFEQADQARRQALVARGIDPGGPVELQRVNELRAQHHLPPLGTLNA